jgi:hypothetical protein
MPSRHSPQKPPADYKEMRRRLQGIRAGQQPVTAAQKNEEKKQKNEGKKGNLTSMDAIFHVQRLPEIPRDDRRAVCLPRDGRRERKKQEARRRKTKPKYKG